MGATTVSDQRIRLIGAMIEAVSANGYAKVSISELVRIAGISKSAFYDHFQSKDECFLVTIDEIVRLATERTATAFRAQSDVRAGLEAAIAATIDNAVAYTDAARLVVVDSIELGRGSLEVRERIAAMLAVMIQTLLEAGAGSRTVSPMTVRAVVGGMRGVLFGFLRDRRPDRMRDHIADLAAWELGYLGTDDAVGVAAAALVSAERVRGRPPAGPAGGAGAPGWGESPKSPCARATLPQRDRIMRGAARMTAEKTYLRLSVPVISADAGTSNQTFYEHFDNKEGAVLAAFDALAEETVSRSAWRLEPQEQWETSAAASILAMLEAFATEPLLAELLFFELPSIGPHAIDHAARALHPFTAFLQPGDVPPRATRVPPPVVVVALTYGLWAIVEQEVIEGRAASLPDLAPELLDIALTPFGVRA